MEAFVGNLSKTVVAEELVEFLESKCGRGGVLACSIETAHANWASRGFGYVQFASPEAAGAIARLAKARELVMCNRPLRVELRKNRMSHQRGSTRATGLTLSLGYLRDESILHRLWSSDDVVLELSYGSSQVNFLVDDVKEGYRYKLELQLIDLTNVERCVVSDRKCLLLQLRRPPHVYQGYATKMVTPVLTNPLAILEHFKAIRANNPSYTYSNWPKEPNWVRSTDFTTSKAISQCLVYCIEFPNAQLIYEEVARSLCRDEDKAERAISVVEVEPYAWVDQEAMPFLKFPDDQVLPLEVEYKLNSLVQNGHLSPAAATQRPLLRLLQAAPVQSCVSALEKLEKGAVASGKTCLDALGVVQNSSAWSKIQLDEGQTYIKRFVVTPCKVYCMGPEVEGSNRVTRKFLQYTDRFARVSFQDEDFGPLHSNATSLPKKFAFQPGLLPEPSDVYRRVRSVLEDGIRIGKQHFKFLAFSASQLRDHSCWMFADSDSGNVTADSIRAWMGDFERFTNVAKCAARMGQSFSSSRQGLFVPQNELKHIDDITSRDGGGLKYCFSDGIGKISTKFATELATRSGCGDVPSAFQIRYGGFKGVVAVDPTSRSKMSLRPSMHKFESEQTGVDVLSWTKFAPYYLNRQIIILMSTLGVKDEAFLHRQGQELCQLDDIASNPELAVEILRASGGRDNKITVEMLLAGYKPSREPFLRRLLDSFRALQLHLLRIKSRIHVPKGRLLMGCLDETGVLDYGQVFVQVSPTPGSQTLVDDGLPPPATGRGPAGTVRGCVVLGKVAIAKNPCLHPGDILLLEAVEVPSLHHMIDCVVFPQRGKRPHPNECSGSDLDGDLYFVTWDPTLVPPLKVEPMSYEPSSPAVLDHSVTIKEIKDFFVDNMLNDSLGVISNAHLVHADTEEERAKHPKCMELAKLASTAVDFAKTGVPAVIPLDLRPRHYPDFMENDFKSTYESKSVLGKLYRLLRKDCDRLPSYTTSTEDIEREYDGSLMVQGYEPYLSEAMSCKELYNQKLSGLLRRHRTTEAEMFTGNLLNKADEKDDRERIGIAMNALLKEARGWFGDDGGDAKAYAWYHVTYHPQFRTTDDHLLSFPWVLSDRLLAIKSRGV